MDYCRLQKKSLMTFLLHLSQMTFAHHFQKKKQFLNSDNGQVSLPFHRLKKFGIGFKIFELAKQEFGCRSFIHGLQDFS